MRTKLLLFTVVLILFFTGSVIAQGTTVKGVVISGEDLNPLAGVNIIVKNTLKGTTTDLDGVYLLEDVSPEDILVFMYVGFSDVEETVGDREEVNVRLTPQALSTEAIVVIGYGTQKRKEVTSAISSIDEGAFTHGAITDPQALLQGRIPGVHMTSSNGDLGAASVIQIRGGTSVSAGNSPLYVIDGVPIDNSSVMPEGVEISEGTMDNPMDLLNPQDIASIDVLKDASASAIYGARGGNGVILITTKEGQPGGLVLNYNGWASIKSQTEKLDFLNASEYKSFATQAGATPDMGDKTTDWQDEIVRDAFSQNHSISFSSGTENTSYLVSLGYLDEQGIVLNSERQRILVRLNLTHKMLDGKLRLGLRMNPSYIKRNNTPFNQVAGYYGGVFTNVYKMNPTQPVYNSDGSYFEYPGSTTIRNPVALVNEIKDETETMLIFANTTAEYDFIPELTWKINLGLNRTVVSRNTYQPTILPYAAAFGGRADVMNNTRQNVLFETTLNYRLDIDAGQRLEAWAGYTFQEFDNFQSAATGQDYVTDGWDYNNLAGGADFTVRPESWRDSNRLISFLGRATYSLHGKYLFNATVRQEGSSRFGEDNKWGTFPSASVGWRLSEESFMQGMGSLSDLKLRLSYGITGNQDIGNYRSLVILGPGANAVIGDEVKTGVASTQLANPDLKWEETTQTNLGIDFGFIENKISGSIDLYTKTTDDLLIEYAVPQPAVVETAIDNAGKVKNEGIEIMLNSINIASGDWFWKTSLNFTSNRNEVVSLGTREFIMTGQIGGAGLSDTQAQIVLPGEPLYTFFGPKFLGYDEDGAEILSNHPGNSMANSGPLNDGRFILGNARPDWTLGFTSITQWKKWDFRFFINWVYGNDILNNTAMEYQRPSNVFNGINLLSGAVDDVNNGMDPGATTAYSDRFIEDGSFIRLQNVTVGYSFDTAWFRTLRVYLSADNLFVLTDYTGYDPEVNTYAEMRGVSTMGMDYTNYPRARTFTVGLNIGIR